MMKESGVVLYLLRQAGIFRHLETSFVKRLSLIILAHLQQDVSLELQVASHTWNIVGLLSQRILLVDFLERLVPLAAIDIDHSQGKQGRAALGITAGFAGYLLYLGRSFIRVSLVQQSHADPLVGVYEVLIDRQRLSILRNRIVKLAHLQKQFPVRVVRVWIVGNELNVFLERLLRVWVINILPVRITEKVIG